MARRKANLAEVIQTDVVGSMPLKTLAKVLQVKAVGGIPYWLTLRLKKRHCLKKHGGRGSRNPDTGLLKFDDGYTVDFSQAEPVISAPEPTVTQAPATFGGDFRDQAAYGDYYVAPPESSVQPVIEQAQPSLLEQAVSPYRFYNAQSVAGIPAVGYDTGKQQFATTTIPSPPGLSPVDILKLLLLVAAEVTLAFNNLLPMLVNKLILPHLKMNNSLKHPLNKNHLLTSC
jgi:hypothetical protein